MMQKYLEKLIEVQSFDPAKRDEFIEAVYGPKATYPEWKFMNFATKEDLFAWTSADNYTFNAGNEGVCYGF